MTKSVPNEERISAAENPAGMRREINWVDAFWIASGASTLVLLSIGSIAATIGTPSWLIWALSTLIGFVQLFIYAEMSGMFPNHSGGASVYGAIAWRKYGKIFAPICIWCNWLGWTPVLALGATLVGSYVVSSFFPANSWLATFSVTMLDHISYSTGDFVQADWANLDWRSGTAYCVLHTALWHLADGTGAIPISDFVSAAYSVAQLCATTDWKSDVRALWTFHPQGTTSWSSQQAFTLVMGGMFIAGWTTYACETAMCYVSEFKNPEQDTIRAVTSSGLLGIIAFGVLPFTFLGVLGMETLQDPALVAGDPQGAMVKMAQMAFGNGLGIWLTIMLIMAVVLSIVTGMAGASRTLYQSSMEGWLPKYLSHLNPHGVPTKAMWTDLVVNLFLLLLGNPIFVLAASCTGYTIGVVMNLCAAWIHRRDRPNHHRPFRAPNWLVNIGAPVLAALNAAFIIFGANTFAPGALWYGLAAVLLVIPIFWYRHFYVDKGVWPRVAQEDLGIEQPLP